MKHDYFKYYNSITHPFLIVGFFVILYLVQGYWKISFSIFTGITILMMLISNYLWKYPPFKYLFWIDDFSGRYEGFLQYQYTDEKGRKCTGKLKHIKLINQNGHKLCVTSFTFKKDGSPSSPSVNKGMYVEKTEDEQHYRLIYNYLNEGSMEQGFPPHYGTEVVKFIKIGKNKKLSGSYYTGREPYQTKGEFIELKWVSNDLNHKF